MKGSEIFILILCIIISIIGLSLLGIYLCNKKFQNLPCYFNIFFCGIIFLDNMFRIIRPSGEVDNYCRAQAFILCLLDKFIISLMTTYTVIQFVGQYDFEAYKKYHKKIIFICGIIGFVLSIALTIIFYINSDGFNPLLKCYVTNNTLKKIIDLTFTTILLLINIIGIIYIVNSLSKSVKYYKSKDEEKRLKMFKKHRLRFIINGIIDILFFIFVYIVNFVKFDKDDDHYYIDVIYVILCLIMVLFYTINQELLHIICCIRTKRTESLSDISSEPSLVENES